MRLVGFWLAGVSALTHIVLWILDESFLSLGLPLPSYVWFLVQIGQAAVLLASLWLAGKRSRTPEGNVAFRAWRWATLLLIPLALVRLVPPAQSQLASLLQIAVSLAVSVLLLSRARRSSPLLRPRFASVFFGLAAGTIVALPWLAIGALGSPVDTLLNLVAAATFGLFFGLHFDLDIVRGLDDAAAGRGRGVRFPGFVASVGLAMLGSGLGFDGSQLLLLVMLPPLGYLLAALASRSGLRAAVWPVAGNVTAVAAAGPLAFVDPDELTLLLGLSSEGELLAWAFRAALLSAALALLLAVAMPRLGASMVESHSRGASGGMVAAAIVAAGLVYFLVGQPGFYGERLFVVMREQAGLGDLDPTVERPLRTRAVYERLVAHADRTQASLRADLDRFGVAYRPYYVVNALEVDGGPLLWAYFASRPEVDRVLDSPHLRPLPAPLPPASGDAPAPAAPEWNLTTIGAVRVWQELGVRGEGIVVGQADSGVDGEHAALRENYRGRATGDDYNWLDPWSGSESPRDLTGHGTHTLGSVLGREGIGVAPEAEWFACVNLERNIGNPAWYLNCMQFVLAPYPIAGDPLRDGDPSLAAHVSNNSWGCPPFEGCEPLTLQPAVEALRAAGIFVVTAAGNEGPFCNSVSDPIAIYEGAFAVGAVDETGSLAFFSSRGPVTADGSERAKPDLVAPGVDILSAFPGGTYSRQQGTSMAGPHVAGVVALMWSAQPSLIGDVERTERILRETASPYLGARDGCFSDGKPNSAYGYGVVDAYAAVKRALEER